MIGYGLWVGQWIGVASIDSVCCFFACFSAQVTRDAKLSKKARNYEDDGVWTLECILSECYSERVWSRGMKGKDRSGR